MISAEIEIPVISQFSNARYVSECLEHLMRSLHHFTSNQKFHVGNMKARPVPEQKMVQTNRSNRMTLINLPPPTIYIKGRPREIVQVEIQFAKRRDLSFSMSIQTKKYKVTLDHELRCLLEYSVTHQASATHRNRDKALPVCFTPYDPKKFLMCLQGITHYMQGEYVLESHMLLQEGPFKFRVVFPDEPDESDESDE
jgi:hypothetical protein